MLVSAKAPLGAALPPVPGPLFEILPAERTADTSFAEKRTIAPWLDKLAPQSDGLPPLITAFQNEVGDFTIMNPYGAQSVVFSGEEILKDGVLAQTAYQFELPLRVIKYSVPTRNEGETLAQYRDRLRSEMAALGAEIVEADVDAHVDFYPFEQLQFKRESEQDGPAGHYVFIGPLGRRALVIDMITTRELFEEAAPLAEKIIRSFKPGNRLKVLSIEEFPELAPEGYTLHLQD
jgi:hypothetical protein